MVEDRHLRHMRNPDSAKTQTEAPSTLLMDFEAMFLRRACEELYGYDGDELAGAYAEYLDKHIVENGNRNVRVYAHTDEAVDTLQRAVTNTSLVYECMVEDLREKVRSMEAELRVSETYE